MSDACAQRIAPKPGDHVVGNFYPGTPGNDSFATTNDDTLAGGAGNDTYVLFTQSGFYPLGAVILENPGEGVDLVNWRWRDPALPDGVLQTYVLPANVEAGWVWAPWALLVGNATNDILYRPFEGHGGGGDDMIIGGAVLRGEDGNDFLAVGAPPTGELLDGGADFDVASFLLAGDAGVVVDLRLQGVGQQVRPAETVTLVSIEGVIGSQGADSLIGTDAANLLVGNAADDTLIGGGGADTLYGGMLPGALLPQPLPAASDIPLLNISGIVPAASFSNEYDPGADYLDGGAGADLMVAGRGAATFIVDDMNDTAIGALIDPIGNGVLVNAWMDTVRASVDYTLDATVDVLVQTGTADIDGFGNAGANWMTPNAGQNHLDAGGGYDVLDFGAAGAAVAVSLLAGTGSAGIAAGDSYVNFEELRGSAHGDTLLGIGAGGKVFGQGGNDLIRAAPGAETINGGEGIDTISYADADAAIDVPFFGVGHDANGGAAAGDILLDVEVLIGSAFNDFMKVQSPAERIPMQLEGGGGDDTLSGFLYAETLIGGEGADSIYGNVGNDLITGGAGNDTIEGGHSGLPKIDTAIFSGASTDYLVSAVFTGRAWRSGDGYVVTWAPVITIADQRAGQPDGTDQVVFVENFRFSDGDRSFGFSYAGTSAYETITGGGGDDTIGGGGPDGDVIYGGNGNDILTAGSLYGEAGNDTLIGSAVVVDALFGGDGNDSLLAGGGRDSSSGGAGDDHVDAGDNLADPDVGELATGDDGNDTVIGGAGRHTLEGGAGDDSLSGGVGMDTLRGGAGRDTLDGGADADLLEGGNGNDTFILDALDSFNDAGGSDTLIVTFTCTLGAGFENLVLAGAGPIDGTGNAAANAITGNDAANRLSGLDGADSLSGGNGKDTLLGGEGNDTLAGGGLADLLDGGLGDDTYIAANNDTILDAGGIDTVMIGATTTLGAGLEHLVLTGTAAISGTGNAAGNSITGNLGGNLLGGLDGADSLNGVRGDDTLVGGPGDDTLAGGRGADAFRYASAAEGADVIFGYIGSEDRVEISAAGFGAGLGAGMDLVAAGRYAQNAAGTATAGQGQFLFSTITRHLSWDADGTGGIAAVLIADLTGAKGWNGAEIVVIA